MAAGIMITGVLACAAQDQGYWRAASAEAKATTGDITITDKSVTIDYYGFTIAPYAG